MSVCVIGFSAPRESTEIIPAKLYHPFRGKVYHHFWGEPVMQNSFFFN